MFDTPSNYISLVVKVFEIIYTAFRSVCLTDLGLLSETGANITMRFMWLCFTEQV